MTRPAAVLAIALLAACSDGLGPLKEAGFKVVATGGDHTCGLVADGRVFCWGSNDQEQLGTRGPHSSVPIRANLGPIAVRDLAAGVYSTCGLLRGGKMLCWGQGETAIRPTGGGQRFESIVMGLFGCGFTGDGNISCWTIPGAVATHIDGGPYFGLDVQLTTACALATVDSTAYCWQRGTTQPVPAGGGLKFTQIAVGQVHTCGLALDATVRCWGGNGNGQLGNNTFDDSPTPVLVQRIVPPESPYVAVVSGDFFSCAIDSSGTAWCWGANGQGQLGHGGIGAAFPFALSVDGSVQWARLLAGSSHMCGVSTDGALYCWGLNSNGQVGDGTFHSQGAPVRVDLGD